MEYIAEPTREETIALFKGGLDKAMMEVAASYVIPIFWLVMRDRQPNIPDNGSSFILDCGTGPFLVTNFHVLRGYRCFKKSNSDAKCIVGDLLIDLDDRLISSDSAWDVATFRLLSAEIAQLKRYAKGKLILTGSQKSWPPEPPTIGRGVFFVGFPGDGRRIRPFRKFPIEIDWEGYTALAVATSVSETSITLYFDHDQNLDLGHRNVPPDKYSLGGCSGAPLLTFVDTNGLFSWRLGGIIFEAGKDILKASSASCLQPDGTVISYPDLMAYKQRDR